MSAPHHAPFGPESVLPTAPGSSSPRDQIKVFGQTPPDGARLPVPEIAAPVFFDAPAMTTPAWPRDAFLAPGDRQDSLGEPLGRAWRLAVPGGALAVTYRDDAFVLADTTLPDGRAGLRLLPLELEFVPAVLAGVPTPRTHTPYRFVLASRVGRAAPDRGAALTLAVGRHSPGRGFYDLVCAAHVQTLRGRARAGHRTMARAALEKISREAAGWILLASAQSCPAPSLAFHLAQSEACTSYLESMAAASLSARADLLAWAIAESGRIAGTRLPPDISFTAKMMHTGGRGIEVNVRALSPFQHIPASAPLGAFLSEVFSRDPRWFATLQRSPLVPSAPGGHAALERAARFAPLRFQLHRHFGGGAAHLR